MKDTLYITASDIGNYVYCKRAWWLQIQGYLADNDAMKEGQIRHTRLSDWLAAYKREMTIAIGLIILGILLTLIAFLIG